METLSNLAFGLGVALSWQNVLYCFIGCFLGTLVGALLAALGAIIALRAFFIDGEPVPRFQLRPIGVSFLALVLFGVALQWAGLVAAVAVLVLVGAWAARDVRPLENLALAGVLVVFSVAVFVWLLGLPLPLWPNS